MQTLSTAQNKAGNFVKAKISKVAGLTKPQVKFLLWLFERWLMLPVRYNFLNLSRYGGYTEKAIRSQFSKSCLLWLYFTSSLHAYSKNNV